MLKSLKYNKYQATTKKKKWNKKLNTFDECMEKRTKTRFIN